MSLAEPPAVDDDAHARGTVARAQFHGHACARLSRIALVIDAPTVLLQRHDAVRCRLVPAMLARRGKPENPVAQAGGGNRRAEPGFELVPGVVGFQLAAITGFQLQLRVRRAAAQLQVHAADTDRAANLHVGAVAALLPVERSRPAILRTRDAETSA